jgi:hypothetical protein
LIKPSGHFAAPTAIRSAAGSEEPIDWFVSDENANGDAATAGQNSRVAGSGLISWTIIVAAFVLGVIGVLIFLFLLRRREEKEIPASIEPEDHELEEFSTSFEEWEDVSMEGCPSLSAEIDE